MQRLGTTVAFAGPMTTLRPNLPVAALVLANAFILAGVLFLGWSLRAVFLIYWMESAVVGVFNLARMFVVGRLAAIPLALFFCAHYGIFMVVHLVFLLVLTADKGAGAPFSGSPLAAVGTAISRVPPAAILALFASHGISFVQNFLRAGEYRTTPLDVQMAAPYKRIVVMHVTVLFGAFLSTALGSSLALVLVLVVAKTAADLHAHLGEHARAARRSDALARGGEAA